MELCGSQRILRIHLLKRGKFILCAEAGSTLIVPVLSFSHTILKQNKLTQGFGRSPLVMRFLMNLRQCGVTLTTGCLGTVMYIFYDRNFRQRALKWLKSKCTAERRTGISFLEPVSWTDSYSSFP